MKYHDPVWFHVDMDAFYAAIEQRDNPEYRGKAVIIGARPGTRGVVSTCSYEARRFGVHSAMPVNQAFKLCPEGIFVPPRIQHYGEVSEHIMDILKDFSPELRQVSIDEAFINMTGTTKLMGPSQHAAGQLKNRIMESTGLTISVGVASNRLVAKMASDFRKPDGLTVIPTGGEAEFVRQLKLSSLWGVGKKTRKRLEELNIITIEQILSISQESLQNLFGKAGGSYLFQIVRGKDPGIYDREAKSHSISNEHTFARDCSDRQKIEDVLFGLAYSIVFRLHRELSQSHTLVLKLRLGDFSTSTIQKSIDREIKTVEDCYSIACGLLKQKWNGTAALRLIGLAFAKVESKTNYTQADFFDDMNEKRLKAETAILELHERYKGLKLSKARNLIRSHDDGEW